MQPAVKIRECLKADIKFRCGSKSCPEQLDLCFDCVNYCLLHDATIGKLNKNQRQPEDIKIV